MAEDIDISVFILSKAVELLVEIRTNKLFLVNLAFFRGEVEPAGYSGGPGVTGNLVRDYGGVCREKTYFAKLHTFFLGGPRGRGGVTQTCFVIWSRLLSKQLLANR